MTVVPTRLPDAGETGKGRGPVRSGWTCVQEGALRRGSHVTQVCSLCGTGASTTLGCLSRLCARPPHWSGTVCELLRESQRGATPPGLSVPGYPTSTSAMSSSIAIDRSPDVGRQSLTLLRFTMLMIRVGVAAAAMPTATVPLYSSPARGKHSSVLTPSSALTTSPSTTTSRRTPTAER